MRWVSGLLLVVTLAAVAWLGFSSTSFSLTNGVGDVACRSVLGPITNAGFAGDGEVPTEVVEAWLLDVGYDDDGRISPDDLAAAYERARDLCAEARVGRIGWLITVAVFGFGLSAGAALLAQSATARPATKAS